MLKEILVVLMVFNVFLEVCFRLNLLFMCFVILIFKFCLNNCLFIYFSVDYYFFFIKDFFGIL